MISGIIIPQTQKQSKPKSKVIAVGLGTREEPMEIKVGDVVTFNKTSAREVDVEGKTCLLIDMSNCLWID